MGGGDPPPLSMLLGSYCSLETPLKKGSPALALAHYFESHEPGEVPHWDEKDAMSTLMDLNEKKAHLSGILADVTLKEIILTDKSGRPARRSSSVL